MKRLLLTDEAIALGAINAGISGVYAYPGTPSTEVTEFIQNDPAAKQRGIFSRWCTNEKTAMEAALGMSFAGKRALVCMKHVGLNVCADPFINSTISGINGGVVVLVADDPSMHSSQNEQDSRNYARMALIPVFEPSNQQEAYDMMAVAFGTSEKLKLPVMLRVVTRLAHSRAGVEVGEPIQQTALPTATERGWVLLPVIARRQYASLLGKLPEIHRIADESSFNSIIEINCSSVQAGNADSLAKDGCRNYDSASQVTGRMPKLGVIACGVTVNYVNEALAAVNASDSKATNGQGGNSASALAAVNASDSKATNSQGGNSASALTTEAANLECVKILKISQYPLSKKTIFDFAQGCGTIVVTEDGSPYIETQVRDWLGGISLPDGGGIIIKGRLSGELPLQGELNPDTVASALGISMPQGMPASADVAPRLPQLCKGCGHRDVYASLIKVMEDFPEGRIFGDIGCYTLGALPPYKALASCIDMGASITMAKGAADAGLFPAVAVIGDSTFTHSGMTGLLDAVNCNSPITVIISDNLTTAMTGGQDSAGTSKYEQIVRALGVDPDHVHVVNPVPANVDGIAELIRREIAYKGVSVIIPRRECMQTARRHKSAKQ